MSNGYASRASWQTKAVPSKPPACGGGRNQPKSPCPRNYGKQVYSRPFQKGRVAVWLKGYRNNHNEQEAVICSKGVNLG